MMVLQKSSLPAVVSPYPPCPPISGAAPPWRGERGVNSRGGCCAIYVSLLERPIYPCWKPTSPITSCSPHKRSGSPQRGERGAGGDRGESQLSQCTLSNSGESHHA
jgi:hypothetical protein